ncbi:hypothetical protein LTR36_010440 [Oleoguttula mirabilis]|uniref:BRCT domain-containing protein n=1 Tax=Oleoguttula mirabilis TaxID=1507867 RepID=A0AAV9J422_9PEZI|nr:hypothetical protein LTR36_010440 [Oleoguttula mirabilis]
MPSAASPAAKPTKSIFDPFNSSATGHQRADSSLSGSTSWRDSRSRKLQEQFSGGTKRVSDTVGAGALDFGQDGRTESGGWVKGAKGLRTGGQKSIWESMGGISKEVERPAKRVKVEKDQQKPTTVVNPWTPFRKEDGTIRETSWTSHESSPSHLLSPIDALSFPPKPTLTQPDSQDVEPEPAEKSCPQIFATVAIYINGSTAPAISDHKLKHLISSHGGRMSISLGRRTVTHVILGQPNSSGGCGGGLAGSKIHKEITRVGGKGLKFVTAEWVLESVKAGKRLPESKFEAMRLAPKGVGSIASMLGGGKRAASGAVKGDEVG